MYFHLLHVCFGLWVFIRNSVYYTGDVVLLMDDIPACLKVYIIKVSDIGYPVVHRCDSLGGFYALVVKECLCNVRTYLGTSKLFWGYAQQCLYGLF